MIGSRLASLRTLSSKVIAKTKPISYLRHVKLYQHVLPWVTESSSVEFLRRKGPEFWKLLDSESEANHHERTQLLILVQPSFTVLLHVYFHLWNQDVCHLPVHLYEMGWGQHLQQSMKTFQLSYLNSLDPTDPGRHPVRVVPSLRHVNAYASLELDYAISTNVSNVGPEFCITDQSLEEMYYLKLFCAESCSKRERWCESFSHALSALDHHDGVSFPYLHNVFCQMALAAGKMSLDPSIWVALLVNAKLKQEHMWQQWRRIVVFHNLLVHHGLFPLERSVFIYGSEHIPSGSNLYTQLAIQHIHALMAQIENIAGFQFLRQTFHEHCNPRTCGKPIIVKYSFAHSSTLIREIEKCIQALHNQGHKQYFQGYVYLYKSFGTVLNVPSETDKIYLEMAKSTFELATLESEIEWSSAMWKDLCCMRSILKNLDVNDVSVKDAFAGLTNARYNTEAANTCFRIVLVFYYWGNVCVKSPPVSFAETAHRAYCKTTRHVGYRIGLLQAVVNQLNLGLLEHTEEEPDYPPTSCMSATNNHLEASVQVYWRRELGQLPTYDENTITTSQDLLEQAVQCQELYAFGAQTVIELIQQ